MRRHDSGSSPRTPRPTRDRADPPRIRGRLPGRPRVRGLDRRGSGSGGRSTTRSPASPGWRSCWSHGPAAASSNGPPPASSTTGARSPSGSRRTGSSTCGTSGATAPTRPRSRSGSPSAARRRLLSRSSSAAGRRSAARPSRGAIATARAGRPCSRTSSPPPRGVVARRGSRRQAPVAAAANDAMSGKVASGVASAGGVAPPPGRPWRRSIQTVVRPSRLAGDVVMEQALGDVEDAVARAGRSVRRRPRSCARRACSSRPAAR